MFAFTIKFSLVRLLVETTQKNQMSLEDAAAS